jgi:hypothetical protein
MRSKLGWDEAVWLWVDEVNESEGSKAGCGDRMNWSVSQGLY